MTFLYYLMKQKWMFVLLLVVNTGGTLYGYIWYGFQLADTPAWFLPFVPDSPTASLFFVFVLLAFLLKKHLPLLEALAAVSLLKYGVWAVGMNIAGAFVSGGLSGENILLILSHGGMAIEGILYSPFYRFKLWHLVVAAVWVLHDIVIDYVFHMMPRYSILADYVGMIGYFTFWLSLLSVFIFYRLVLHKNHNQLEL